MNCGHAIATLRATRGHTQEKLAGMCGLTPGFISMLEGGQRGVSLPVLEQIAAALDIPLFMLFVFASSEADIASMPEPVFRLLDAEAMRSLGMGLVRSSQTIEPHLAAVLHAAEAIVDRKIGPEIETVVNAYRKAQTQPVPEPPPGFRWELGTWEEPGRSIPCERLISKRGKEAAIVYHLFDIIGFAWHTWDLDGIGSENAHGQTIPDAKTQAIEALRRQRWHGLK